MSDVISIVPNIVAMISSLIAMVMLGMVAPKLGGALGTMLRLLIGGIFFAVFIHAGFELAEGFGLLSEGLLLKIMGVLLSIGSLSFILAAWTGLRALR